MLPNVAFHTGLHCLLSEKWSSEKKCKLKKIVTCDPLNYAMDHTKYIASIQKKELISAFKGSADYYIQQQSLNYTGSIIYLICLLFKVYLARPG